MTIHAAHLRRRALEASAIAGLSFAGVLGFSVDQAVASYKAHVQAGTLADLR
ncbi:MAG: hypothetical protein WBP81_11770 [Solirubrobacteraceae bacterium]